MLVDMTPSQEMVDERVCKGGREQDTETQKEGGIGRGEREWGKEGCEGRRGGGVWKKDGGSEEGRREGCGMDLVKLYF